MKAEPKIESRPEQPYVGKRIVMPMSEFGNVIPTLISDVSKWLDGKNVEPAGPPFLRYRVINMPERMDVEVGIPVDQTVAADDQIASDSLPAGRFATLTYEGVKNGVAANAKLIDWIGNQGEEMACYKSQPGDAFEARYEIFLTDAQAEPDQNKWKTEVAIKLRD
jgi:effector-binding domain-containing protein